MAAVDALMRAAKRKHPKVGIFWPSHHDPDFERHFYNTPRPPMQNTLVPDGPARHPVLGSGYPQHPFLPIYRQRRPRRS